MPTRLHLSAVIAVVSSFAYLACGTTDSGKGSPGTGGDTSASAGHSVGGGASAAAGASDAAGSDAGGNDGIGGVPDEVAGATGDAGSGPVGGEPSTITLDTFAFYHPALVSGADGVLHLAFNTNTSPSVMHYARCAAGCGDGANWTVTKIGSYEFTGGPRLVIGSDDRLHLLYDVSAMGVADQLIYATCASDCTDAASWVKTDLASLANGGWNSPSYGSPFVIDQEDRLSFTVDRKIYLNGGVTLGTCASDCSKLGNWSAGTISATGTRTSLAAHGTTLHQLIDNAAGNGTGNRLAYRTCAGDCTKPASWQELPDLFVYDGAMPNAIAVTAAGGLRVVYNQGVTDAGESPPIKAQDSQILIWGCDDDCLKSSSWSGFASGTKGDGSVGLSLAGLGEGLVLALSNGDRVLTRYCGSNCLDSASWSEADVDTVDAVTNDYDPYAFSGTTCNGLKPTTASWNLTQGVVAIRPDASLTFVHTASILRACPGSSSVGYLPGFGRLVFAP